MVFGGEAIDEELVGEAGSGHEEESRWEAQRQSQIDRTRQMPSCQEWSQMLDDTGLDQREQQEHVVSG